MHGIAPCFLSRVAMWTFTEAIGHNFAVFFYDIPKKEYLQQDYTVNSPKNEALIYADS